MSGGSGNDEWVDNSYMKVRFLHVLEVKPLIVYLLCSFLVWNSIEQGRTVFSVGYTYTAVESEH